MFERYTREAKRILVFARYEAQIRGSAYIEPEHILFGILREQSGIADKLTAGEFLVQFIKKPENKDQIVIPFSPASIRLLTSTSDQADQLQDPDIGTEHLLLGLLAETDLIPTTVLNQLGLEVTLQALSTAKARGLKTQ
jgi:ATP-dependent Clp protease ATP-binding subunit ClpC